MKQLYTVIKNELIRYFTSPLAYVYLISFLILNGSCAIYFGHFIERGIADLSPMFAFQPWLYLLFISGIAMRLWAEEFKSKTVVQIMTMPVSTITLVWGKFFASWIFSALALALTFPFIITVNILGTPDNSLIFLGYIGSLVIAGCMLAIAQTMSALTKNQVIALVLAVIANMMFFLSGLEYILSVLRPISPSYIIDMVASFSFLTHFNTIVAGLVELRDIVFFASIIFLFNFTTVIIIDFKTSGTSAFLKSDNKKSYVILFAAFMLIFIGANLIANNMLRRFQYDFTQEKIYTLNKNTKDILKNLENPVTIKLYYSPILGKNDPIYREMFDRLSVLLSQYKAVAGKNIEYKIYMPYPFDRVEDIALSEKIEPLPSVENNNNAMFGATITDDLNNKRVIPFFAPERAAFMEQDLTEAIYLLHHEKTNLGIISSLPILGGETPDGMIYDNWEIANQLAKFYNLKEIKTADDFEDIELLMIVHPKDLDEALQEKIKEYANGGGKALIFLDIGPEASRLSSTFNTKLEPSDFEELAKFFGFKFYTEYVAADFDNSILVNASSDYKVNTNFTNDVIQFIEKQPEMNPKMQETSGLKEIMFSSAGLIMPASSKVNFVSLIRASKNSAILPADVVIENTNPADILRFYTPDDNSKILAARIFNKDITKPFDIVVVTDTDMLYDDFWTKIYNLPNSRYIVPILDNANFVLNAAESLSRKNYLSSLRGKSAQIRRFDKIERLRRQNKLEYSKNELAILEEIDQVKAKLQEIWQRKSFENREMFTSEDLLTIKNIRSELDNSRRKLGQIRKDSSRHLEHIYTQIKFVNIYLIALIISLMVLLHSLIKKARTPKVSAHNLFDRKLSAICSLGIFALVLGVVAVFVCNRSTLDSYENKPVFEKLTQNINQAKTIEVSDHNNKVRLTLEDGIWKNKEHPDFVVVQEQVRSFLSAMIEASYYEKKSDKAENLAFFGLLPLQDEHSTALNISVKDKNDEVLAEFLLGEFDIDFGRGAKAAYIRFDKSFQVWLINADFIDATTDWKLWNINTMWDLRIGRLQSFNAITDQDLNANMAKILINTKIIESVDKLENAEELGKIILKDENYNAIYLYFYRQDGKYYVQYKFLPPINGFYAKLLAESTKDKYYLFDEKNWELIDYARKATQP